MKTEEDIPSIDISSFPSIEIDTEYWSTLSAKDRLRYIMRLVFHEKDLSNKLKMMNYLVKTISRITNGVVTNKEIRGWVKLMEYSGDMFSTFMALGSLFKAKQTFRSTKNNDIAKLMGFPSGSHINEVNLEVTNAMVEAFLDMRDNHKKKYGISIDNLVDDDGKKGKDGEENEGLSNRKVMLAGTYGEEGKTFKFGMTFSLLGSVFDATATTSVSKAKLFYPITGMPIDPDTFLDDIQRIFYEMYVEKINVHANFMKIDGSQLVVCPRIEIRENITNIDVEGLTRAGRKTLENKRRRGVVLVGEPGTGKTIATHKIINNFRDKLVFWVSADSINSTAGIRNIRKMFKMFEGCIVVFDDLDAAPLTAKNEVTNEFLSMLDGTNKMSCFMLATVNDPSKIHMAIINRAERFDDIVEVKKPREINEVSDIIISKANDVGYFFKKDSDRATKGILKFTAKSEEFKVLCQKILDASFTQVMVAGLVSDCEMYATGDDMTIADLDRAIVKRLESINCANMKAVKGRLVVDNEEISEEAKAMLSVHR